MDAAHPQHNSVPAYGWIKKGHEAELKANCGRQRLNINGVIDVATLKTIVRFDGTVNADSTLNLFKQIERKHRKAKIIYIIADNARYYRFIQSQLNRAVVEVLPKGRDAQPVLSKVSRLCHSSRSVLFKYQRASQGITLPTDGKLPSVHSLNRTKSTDTGITQLASIKRKLKAL